MLFSKRKGLTIDTLIGEGTAIDGDLVFSGGLRLDGKVRGNIRAAGDKPSMLVISEKGMVEGELAVGHLILNGTVKGPVHASELLELQPRARVLGEVRYAALEMHQGALVEGRLIPLGQEDIKALPNLSSTQGQSEAADNVPLPGEEAEAGKAA
ncbi:bactofilin family protein [Cupriavidus pinatubonensis]|uniref:Uncharacterized protein n=1 Tax=Cupriavidus pinatubonensis TaxID=248026 RepID=A0ABM8W960_9BURK|nr:polymer-forming cytoskeletal protein [Cupriavidus pinatubonensis]CAG9163730.1 hypothetical protein LMG23994_00245 [Cupriavidus pinatubonensis]